MALVDVLMPLGSVPLALVQRAVGSVLDQSLDDLRLMVIDDGATAESMAWIASRARADRRLDVRRTRTPGIVAALGTGLEGSDASLVARMDADDVAMPWRLELQARLLGDQSSLDLVAAPVYLEGAAQAGWIRHVSWSNRLMTPEEHAAERFVDAPVVHPTVMVRRAKLETWGGYRQGPFAEDYELWLRAMAAGARFAKIDAPGLVWNRGPSTLTVASPRYGAAAMARLRVSWLAHELAARGGRFAVWGAGESGRRLMRELEAHQLVPDAVFDIDARKVGRTVRSQRIQDAAELQRRRPWEAGVTVVTAVAAPGARYLIGQRLGEAGAVIGRDWLPAA